MVKLIPISKSNPQDRVAENKYYAQVVSSGKTDLERLAYLVANQSTVREADCYAVILSLLHNIVDELKQGKIVKLDKLGSFQIGINSDAVETAEPTEAILTEGQAKTYDIGIRKPLIDEAIIRNSISGGAQTAGSSRTPNPKNAADTFDDGKTTEQKKEDAQYGNEFDTQNSFINDFDGGTNSVTQNVLRTKSGSVVTSSDGSPVYVDN